MRALKQGTLAAILAGACLAGAGPAAASSQHGRLYPMSVRYGGNDHRIDTLAKVRALLLSQHTTKHLLRTLAGLRPVDRRYVIRMGIEPARIVVSRDATTGLISPTLFAVPAIANGCSGYSANYAGFHAAAHSYAGIWLYTYHSQWAWNGCYGHVWQWSHSQWPTFGAIPGWSYQGEFMGRTYGGAPGSWMVGRDMFGYFLWISHFAVSDTAELQVQVNGNPGWWSWANITGP